ncbi:MAG: cache domain-containing protein, partial [Alphaproteobacteria bacterium]|nr:cache domain-containing protein [Alphaproteobacteria bacterium]
MSHAELSEPGRSSQWGLAAKLFAILLLLGAIAVLATSVMGYVHARDALQEAIYKQLTTARKSKARQIETYFRTIRSELSQLATTQMVIDATRGFNAGFGELDAGQPDPGQPDPELAAKVEAWYADRFAPQLQRVLGKPPDIKALLPIGPAATWLQYYYIATNPFPPERRSLLDNAGDGSAWSRQHAISHPMLRAAAASYGFFDFMLADPRTGRIVYGVAKEIDLGASLRTGSFRDSNLAAAVARCSTTPDRSAVCFEDFAPYAPSGGAPIAFMAAPVIDQGRVAGVLIAQLSIEEIDDVVTGGRHWQQEGFGNTGEAYLVGPDNLVRSGPRAFYEDPQRFFAELAAGGESQDNIDAVRRYGTPVLHQRVATEATRSALAGLEGTAEIPGYRGTPTLASWGPLAIPGTKWAVIAKVDLDEAFQPIDHLRRQLLLVGGIALVAIVLTSAWLSRSLLG